MQVAQLFPKTTRGFVQFAQRKISLKKTLEKCGKWCIIKTVDKQQRLGTAKYSEGIANDTN